MTVFTQQIEKQSQIKVLKEALKENKNCPAMAVGLSPLHKSAVLACLAQEKNPIIVVTGDEQNARKLCNDFNFLAGEDIGLVFPDRDLVIRSSETASNEYELIRLKCLTDILYGNKSVVFCSALAACSYTMPKKVMEKAVLTLKVSQEYPQQKLLDNLLFSGYARRDQVDGPGQFASRGGIVDIYSVCENRPFRLEYWGDEIDSLSFFDLDSQRRTDSLDEIKVSPAKEFLIKPQELIQKMEKIASQKSKSSLEQKAKNTIKEEIELLKSGISLSNNDKYIPLIYDNKTTVLDWFEDPKIFISERVDVKQAGDSEQKQWIEDQKILIEDGILTKGLDDYMKPFVKFWEEATSQAVFLETFARSGDGETAKIKKLVSFNATQLSVWSGELKVLIEDIKEYKLQGYTVVVLAGTEKAAKALLGDVLNADISCSIISNDHDVADGSVYIMTGSVSAGFAFDNAKFAVITHSSMHAVKKKKRPKHRKGEEIKSLTDLSKGDLVVHSSHGIGTFLGIEKMKIQEVEKDYIKIQYAGTDVLYLPVTQMDLVSKYIGSENRRIKLNKFGGKDWQNTKSRVKKAVDEMAQELILLYAKREKAKGYAFSEDNDWMRGFEQRFEYEETQDQLRSIHEIKKDMEKPRPMDRLLCGDVGFGKTEVALRAAFKCVMDGKQCAILCPTTILAWQHYQNVLARLGDFPVNVELLSRFRTKKQQGKIIKKLKTGEVDIIIGTHRVVQKDVEFKDLGLAIIDEEQRFGVTQKERFKEIFSGVDILTLSATPIPRTLNMAMSGIRDMSVLEEPPQDRQPVQTYVMEFDSGVIAQALKRELRRDGQVYYIHNRVETINSCAARVQELVPGARVGVAHGKMGEKELSEIWRQIMEHELDILVCTTIIETGVDLPNVNTMIIENAENMGLSQLYQLRGRVGRSKRRAFAYFTFVGGKVLSEISAKRLSAIREFTKFGSGFRIALRDLEIRGAGSLLGERQHGQMEAVGYDMYLKILSQAVAKAQGEEAVESSNDCIIDVPISAHIPKSYIANDAQRLDIYKKIAALKTQEDKMDLTDELIDRFSEPPESVMGLMEVALLRHGAAQLGFVEISVSSGHMRFYPDKLDMEKMSALLEKLGKQAKLNAGSRPFLSVALNRKKPIDVMREVLE